MKIEEIREKKIWSEFLEEARPHSFLQSWEWAEMQERLGTSTIRLGVYEGGELRAIALVLHIKARRGAFLFCPHGPVIRSVSDKEKIYIHVKEELQRRGEELDCSFIRISSLEEDSEENRRRFRLLGFRPAPIHLMHPERAWLLDLQKSEEELLKEMRKTTRYLIRKAEKEGVEVRQTDDDLGLKEFLKVYRTTVDRQNFMPFKDNFFEEELRQFKAGDHIKVFLAEHQGRVIAAAIIVFYGQSAFYHHGASDATHSQIPASYLLQWRVIQEAKRRGLKFYNFWGVVRPEEKKHPWAGLSLFKTGFGGFAEEYMHAEDFPLTQRYWVNYLIELVRRKWRRL